MLTIDFDRLGIRAGDKAIDIGAGQGRHTFEMARRGVDITAFDMSESDMSDVAHMLAAMREEDQIPAGAEVTTTVGDALALPYEDDSFDAVVASEILEHIPHDDQAIAELVRVLKPGGVAAISVPASFPEKICWAFSDEYHEVEGGHVRIYAPGELAGKLEQAGLTVTGTDKAHALHSPFWWLKCAVGVDNDDNILVKKYHELLVWDMMKAPMITRKAEELLNPFIGKSIVLYARK